MTTSSDDDDDDLFEHVGLSVRKQKAANKKRDSKALYVQGLLEEHNQRIARRARLVSAVKLEENDAHSKKAEAALSENLQSMEDRSKRVQEEKAELKAGKTTLNKESARDVGQSSLVGCRVGVIERPSHNNKKKKSHTTASSWKRLVSKANQKKHTMVRFLSENFSLLQELLTSKVLLSKFPIFPPPVLEWLWDVVLNQDSGALQDAAFETLHEYVLMGNNINDSCGRESNMLRSYQTHFVNTTTATTTTSNDKHDTLVDLQHFLDLQKCLLEQQGTIEDTNEAAVLLTHVSLACLDVKFHGNRVSRSWRSFVSVLLDLVQSTLDDAQKWQAWQHSTSQDISAFFMKENNLPGTPHKMNDGDDDDDESEVALHQAQLSQAVLVRTMVLANPEFGAILAQETWNQLVHQKSPVAKDKEPSSSSSLAIHILTDAVTTFHSLNQIPDMQGAHILASCQCLVSGISGAWTLLRNDDNNNNNDLWKRLDSELTVLANRLRKLSIRHGHFRRAEIVISSQLRGRVTQELQDASSSCKVQSSLQQWKKKDP